ATQRFPDLRPSHAGNLVHPPSPTSVRPLSIGERQVTLAVLRHGRERLADLGYSPCFLRKGLRAPDTREFGVAIFPGHSRRIFRIRQPMEMSESTRRRISGLRDECEVTDLR